jgi:hypothetical protein
MWERVMIGDVFNTSSGGTPLKSKQEYFNGNIPWLKSGEISQGLVYKAEDTITELGLKNSSAKLFPPETVLVAMYGVTAGLVGLLKFGYCYTMYDDDKRRAGEYSNETVQEATLVRLINANYHYNRPLPALYQWKDRKKRT